MLPGWWTGRNASEFDLAVVYWYRCSNPERAYGWWVEQVHKSLFEEQELSQLLTAAGFDRFIVFCYEYPRDNNRLPTTLGFMAVAPGGECGKTLYPACLELLEEYTNTVVPGSVQFLTCCPTFHHL